MKRITPILFLALLTFSCNWLDNKKDQAEQKIKEEFEQHVLQPISNTIFEIGEEVFNPPYDSVAAVAYCDKLRPNPLKKANLQDIPKVGYQYSILTNTPDSTLSHIDASFFEKTEKYFPIKFPYFLEYHDRQYYFHLRIGHCQFSDLPEIGIFPFKEIFQLAIYNHYLMIATYDDDRSFWSPNLEGIMYYIIDLNNHKYFEYSVQKDFDLARRELTKSNDNLMGWADFIRWYETYRSS